MDPGERCDAGLENRNEPDALCRTDCQLTRCSDGIVDSNEVCDDGNNTLGDGCAADCQSNEVCGNGVLDPVTPTGPEQCDDAIAGLSSDGCSSKCDLEFGNWAPLQPTQPEPRNFPIAAVDVDRKRLVMFGGTSAANNQLNDTWSYDGVAWRPVFTPTTPDLAIGASAMAYDPVGHVMIAYAGGTQTTWRFDGFDWKALTTAHHPEAYSGFAMASAPAQGGVMLFGGRLADGTLRRQTYVFTNGDWRLVAELGPSARDEATMTYSETWGVLLFGGYDNVTHLRDTWTFEPTGWRLLNASGPVLSRPKMSSTSFFDPLLHGGTSGDSFNDALYFFDGEWFTVPLASAGTQRANHVFAVLDAKHAVVFGGIEPNLVTSTALADRTVNFDSTTKKFTTVNPTLAGVPTRGAAVYDSARGVVVVLTPVAGVPEPRFGTMKTWEFDGYSWREISTATTPPIRSGYGMAYAPDLQQVVVFGGTGYNGGALDDVWLYDGDDWSQPVVTGERPMARREHYFGHLPGVGLIALGGVSNSQNANDLWLLQPDFEGFKWAQLQPTSPGPSDFFDVVGAYDASRGALVLQLHTQAEYETWLFNGDWTQLQIETVNVNAPAMAYDPTRRSVVAFGGVGQTGLRANTYELTDQWREVRTANTPPASTFGQMVFHDAAKHMMHIGGRQGFGDSNEVWLRSFSSARTAPDACVAGVDSDLDGLIACGDATHSADPDCWPQCTPQCPPTLGAIECRATLRCGDGHCAGLETYLVCPADCLPPP